MVWTILVLVLLNVVGVAMISEDERNHLRVILGVAVISASYVLEYMHLTDGMFT